MSVRAEHRWQRRLAAEAQERESARHTTLVFAALNSTRLTPGAPTPFCETYLRKSPGDGWDLVNIPDHGWSSSSRWFRSIRDCLRQTNIVIVAAGSDSCSFFYRVRPATNGERLQEVISRKLVRHEKPKRELLTL